MTDHQLTAEDVHALTVSRRYDDIEQARLDGRLDLMLGRDAGEVELLDRARHTQEALSAVDVTALHKLGRVDLIEAARRAGRLTFLTDTDTDTEE